METVFDHNITKEEWNYICGLEKEKYLSIVDEESSKIHLAALFYYRGDRGKAESYLESLPPLIVNDFWRTVTHP